MAYPAWRRILEEAKRQAIKAMDEYNCSTGDYGHFVRDMVRAWLYLLHAEFRYQKVDIHYRNVDGSYRLVDGEPKAWELATCVERRFPDQNDPIRKNVELFAALRNKIEHRYQRAVQAVTGGRAHALVINFEKEMVAFFGEKHTIGDKLRFPVFVQSITEAGAEELRKLERSVPKATSAFLSRFESGLAQDVRDDARYDFRVRLVPIVGAKTDADLAVNFVNIDKLSDEEVATLMAAGREGKVLTKIKRVDVASKDKLLPSQVVRDVNDRVPYVFTMNHHTLLWKHFAIRPSGRTGDRSITDPRYCVYDEPFKSYVYTKAWVEKIVREVGTPEKLRALVGIAPRTKLSQLPVQRSSTVPEEGSSTSAAG